MDADGAAAVSSWAGLDGREAAFCRTGVGLRRRVDPLLLGLGIADHPLYPEVSYAAFWHDLRWKKIYGIEFLDSGPLFTPPALPYVDLISAASATGSCATTVADYSRTAGRRFRAAGVRDAQPDAMGAATGNTAGGSRPATVLAGRGGWWTGWSESSSTTRPGADPFGPDDGTVAPWVVVASLPFAPEIVLPTIQNYEKRMQLKQARQYGYKANFNPTFPVQPKHEHGWVSPYHFGINQGPIVIMIENHCSGLLWSLCGNALIWSRACGRQITGGWLE